MTRYLIQMRLVRLPNPDDEPDRWSSATSTMTTQEVSVPFDADDHPKLDTSQPYLDAVTRAVSLLALPPDPAADDGLEPGEFYAGERFGLPDPWAD